MLRGDLNSNCTQERAEEFGAQDLTVQIISCEDGPEACTWSTSYNYSKLLKWGLFLRGYIGDYYRGYGGYYRSLDYSSCISSMVVLSLSLGSKYTNHTKNGVSHGKEYGT